MQCVHKQPTSTPHERLAASPTNADARSRHPHARSRWLSRPSASPDEILTLHRVALACGRGARVSCCYYTPLIARTCPISSLTRPPAEGCAPCMNVFGIERKCVSGALILPECHGHPLAVHSRTITDHLPMPQQDDVVAISIPITWSAAGFHLWFY